MFTQGLSGHEKLDHYAADELAVLREEKLTQLQAARFQRTSRVSRNSPIVFSARDLTDLEDEISIIETELSFRRSAGRYRVPSISLSA